MAYKKRAAFLESGFFIKKYNHWCTILVRDQSNLIHNFACVLESREVEDGTKRCLTFTIAFNQQQLTEAVQWVGQKSELMPKHYRLPASLLNRLPVVPSHSSPTDEQYGKRPIRFFHAAAAELGKLVIAIKGVYDEAESLRSELLKNYLYAPGTVFWREALVPGFSPEVVVGRDSCVWVVNNHAQFLKFFRGDTYGTQAWKKWIATSKLPRTVPRHEERFTELSGPVAEMLTLALLYYEYNPPTSASPHAPRQREEQLAS